MIRRAAVSRRGPLREAVTIARCMGHGVATQGKSSIKSSPTPAASKSKEQELADGKAAEESLLVNSEKGQETQSSQAKKKTMAEVDEELRLKLEGISGEGGGAGIEYEGGKAVGLKRGVKENMFRVI